LVISPPVKLSNCKNERYLEKTSIPAKESRKIGAIYDTPKGKMKWIGTGWVSAESE